jgi:hypothetical protein
MSLRRWTSFLHLGVRAYTERILFVAGIVTCFLWYFQEKETYSFWRHRAAKFSAELWGFDTQFTGEYKSRDATGDWVAFAITDGLLSGFTDARLSGLDFTRGKLADYQLKELLAPLPDPLPAANTPLILRYCLSQEAHRQPQVQPGWLSFKAPGNFVVLNFGFSNPLVMEKMPRLVVAAQPAAIFDGTPVRFFWRGPDRKQPVTERLRSMSAYFRVRGDVAVAELPLGRLVEWTNYPLAGMVRMDLTPKGPEGRIRMIALGARH